MSLPMQQTHTEYPQHALALGPVCLAGTSSAVLGAATALLTDGICQQDGRCVHMPVTRHNVAGSRHCLAHDWTQHCRNGGEATVAPRLMYSTDAMHNTQKCLSVCVTSHQVMQNMRRYLGAVRDLRRAGVVQSSSPSAHRPSNPQPRMQCIV